MSRFFDGCRKHIFVCNRTRNFAPRCVDDGRKSKSHFYIYLLLHLQHISLHISGVILQNLDWLQLKFDFVSGTVTISTEFSSGLKFPPISNKTAA
jgi:hypothetical protein